MTYTFMNVGGTETVIQVVQFLFVLGNNCIPDENCQNLQTNQISYSFTYTFIHLYNSDLFLNHKLDGELLYTSRIFVHLYIYAN